MKKLILTGIAVAMMTAWNATASFVFQTPAGSSDTDGPVSAQATITFGTGYMTMVLQNLDTGSILSAGQALSGVVIDFGNNSQVTSSTTFGTSFSAKTGNFSGSGTVSGITTLTGSLSNPANHWGYASGYKSLTVAAAGTGADSGNPVDLILPDGTKYVSGTGSYNNPYIIGSAFFTFSNSLFTASSKISGLTFDFGTCPITGIGGRIPSVPEPSTVIAGALLLLPFGFSTFRVLRKYVRTS